MHNLNFQGYKAGFFFSQVFGYKRNYVPFSPIITDKKVSDIAVSTMWFYRGRSDQRGREVIMDSHFTKATALRAAHLVCTYVEAESRIDQAVIANLFADRGFDGFEVVKKGSSEAFGVYFAEDIKKVFRASFEVPLPVIGASICHLHMTTRSPFLCTNRDLSKEEIEKDPLLVWFSHSKKFRQFSQYDHLLQFARIIEKL